MAGKTKQKNNSGLVLAVLILFAFLVLATLFMVGSIGDFGFGGGTVAVVPVNGLIVSDQGSMLFTETVSPSEVRTMVEKAESDPGVSAILVEINSPGGNAVPSFEIAGIIRNSSKPTVAWISDMGASGGYLVAASCNYTIAHPVSLTGSIGVISTFQNLQGLFDEFGVNFTVIKTGEFKDIGSSYRDMTEDEVQMWQTLINEVYSDFKKAILEYRAGRISPSELDQISDGRILSGRQALSYNLVDAVGSREDAVKKAGELAGLEGVPDTVSMKEEKGISIFDLLGMSIGRAFAESFQSVLRAEKSGSQLELR